MERKGHSVLSGTNLILGVDGAALGFSTGCKVSTTVETGERITKESADGKWPEKYVKKFSEDVSADGFVLTDSDKDIPTYDILKDLMLKEEPVAVGYSLRDGSQRTGKAAGGYKGRYLITSLELDGQAGDDAKYSIKLESCGAVTKVGNGLTETAADNG
ncbi:MAG: phage tail protein [Muribaculum sp.]|nr:phage tail protein [Muribaculum sp.]